MSKFFKIEDDLINLCQISGVNFDEEKLTITFEIPEKSFCKDCKNQKEFQGLRELVSAHLDIIDLGEANNPNPPKDLKVTFG